MHESPNETAIVQLLKNARTIAVVGLSPKEYRDSNKIARYMQAQGYRIIPVNPGISSVLGEPGVPRLADITEPVDIVNVFRRSEFVPAIVDDAIAIGARAVWTQLGIGHDDAAAKARAAGLVVVMNRCIMVEHQRYFLNT